MRKLSILLIVAALLVSGIYANAQKNKIKGSNNYITKEFHDIKNFNSITVEDIPDIEYTQSKDGKTHVSVYTADNLMEYIDISVNGKTLVVKLKPGYNKNTWIQGEFKVKVSSPELVSVKTGSTGKINILDDIDVRGNFNMTTSSTGNITAKNIKCDDIIASASSTGSITVKSVSCNKAKIKTSSTGNITIREINAETIDASTSSTGKINLSGKVTDVTLSSSSTGSINAGDLKAQNVKAIASSTGSINCYAEKSISGRSSSIGKITYNGEASIVDIGGRTKTTRKK